MYQNRRIFPGIMSFVLLMTFGCLTTTEYEPTLSKEEVKEMIFDIEVAKGAMSGASTQLKDSIFNEYLTNIGLRYGLSVDSMGYELSAHMAREEQIVEAYDWMIGLIDTMRIREGE